MRPRVLLPLTCALPALAALAPASSGAAETLRVDDPVTDYFFLKIRAAFPGVTR